ncbi:hypothetical protein [Micromonospora sediminicola]|uniref:hypothetical protein n=1 Tax=Micromonospora sediminicola TaxID=946078 RepID=UPI003F4BA19E
MARRGWGGSTAAALGVAAGAGAAQLGFGYGLGIINWAPTGSVRVEAAWVASLAWATWIAATSVIAGAVCAQRLRGGGDEPVGTLPRLGLALAAGAGALITVLLVAVPARSARVPDTSSPQTVAATYAAVGLVLGVLLATWALHTRAAATNLIATTGWLWLLAVVSVIDGVLSGRGLSTAQLGIWQISADRAGFWIRDYFYWPGVLLSLGSALVIGVLAARRAVRPADVRVGAAASGAAGPLLVSIAYLLAVPRLAGIAAEQLSAHLIAPYAVIAGLAGSVLVAALAQRADRRATDRASATASDRSGGEVEPVAGETEPAGPLVRHRTAADTAQTVGSRPDAAREALPEGGRTRRFFGRRRADAAAGDMPGSDASARAEGPAGEPVDSVDRLATPVDAPAPPPGAARTTRSDRETTTGRTVTTGPGSATGAKGTGRKGTPGAGGIPGVEGTTGAERAAPGVAADRTDRRPGSAGGDGRTAAERRGRAVPQQRQHEEVAVADRPDGTSSTDESDAGDAPAVSPATEPKARRRTR